MDTYEKKWDAASYTVPFTITGASAVSTSTGITVTPSEGVTIATGGNSFTATKGGKYTIAYNGYTKDVVVNMYSFDKTSPAEYYTIDTQAGSATLKLTKNKEAEVGTITIVKGTDESVTTEVPGFITTVTGNNIKIKRNGALAGTYTVKYTVNGVVVAKAILKVTSQPANTTEKVGTGTVTW